MPVVEARHSSLIEVVGPMLKTAAGMLRPFYGNTDFGYKDKTDRRSVVTRLDAEVEAFLRVNLRSLDSDIGFVGEESGGARARRHWLCDPIDGTQEFVNREEGCTILLALVEDGRVVFSAINDFSSCFGRDIIYHAVRDKGAFCNGTRISVSHKVADFDLAFESNLFEAKEPALRKVAKVHRAGTAGFELIRVARGDLDGRVSLKPWGKDYDFAAGALLVHEAGGKVANLGKRDYDHNDLDFIAATPTLYAELTRGPKSPFPVL